MKKSLLVLLIPTLLLTGCNKVSEADIHLKDGSTMRLTNNQMSEDEYNSLINNLIIETNDFDYVFNCKKRFNHSYNQKTTGTFAYYEEGNKSINVHTFNVDLTKVVNISKRIVDDSDYFQEGINGYYQTYNGKLDVGTMYKQSTITDSLEIFETNNRTPKKEYIFNVISIQNYLGTYINIHGPSFGGTTYESYSDPIIHSHKLNKKYFVLEQVSKSIPNYNPIGKQEEKEHYWKSLNDTHYCKIKYYFNLETGKLDKQEINVSTIEYMVGFYIRLTATLTFNEPDMSKREKEIDDHFDTFIHSKDVSTREPNYIDS
ncbi:MAG: hypothetical protein K5906_02420 [Bacilli bacterium]|nr:hypothetical protein [Bacilli bacterium]